VFYRFCGPEPAAVGIYKLVPDDVDTQTTRRKKLKDKIEEIKKEK
jgi:hypothetical protein